MIDPKSWLTTWCQRNKHLKPTTNIHMTSLNRFKAEVIIVGPDKTIFSFHSNSDYSTKKQAEKNAFSIAMEHFKEELLDLAIFKCQLYESLSKILKLVTSSFINNNETLSNWCLFSMDMYNNSIKQIHLDTFQLVPSISSLLNKLDKGCSHDPYLQFIILKNTLLDGSSKLMLDELKDQHEIIFNTQDLTFSLPTITCSEDLNSDNSNYNKLGVFDFTNKFETIQAILLTTPSPEITQSVSKLVQTVSLIGKGRRIPSLLCSIRESLKMQSNLYESDNNCSNFDLIISRELHISACILNKFSQTRNSSFRVFGIVDTDSLPDSKKNFHFNPVVSWLSGCSIYGPAIICDASMYKESEGITLEMMHLIACSSLPSGVMCISGDPLFFHLPKFYYPSLWQSADDKSTYSEKSCVQLLGKFKSPFILLTEIIRRRTGSDFNLTVSAISDNDQFSHEVILCLPDDSQSLFSLKSAQYQCYVVKEQYLSQFMKSASPAQLSTLCDRCSLCRNHKYCAPFAYDAKQIVALQALWDFQRVGSTLLSQGGLECPFSSYMCCAKLNNAFNEQVVSDAFFDAGTSFCSYKYEDKQLIEFSISKNIIGNFGLGLHMVDDRFEESIMQNLQSECKTNSFQYKYNESNVTVNITNVIKMRSIWSIAFATIEKANKQSSVFTPSLATQRREFVKNAIHERGNINSWIDLGCGDAQLFRHLLSSLDINHSSFRRIIGVDINKTKLREGHKKLFDIMTTSAPERQYHATYDPDFGISSTVQVNHTANILEDVVLVEGSILCHSVLQYISSYFHPATNYQQNKQNEFVVTCIEVIEHLPCINDAVQLGVNILNIMTPRKVIFSTPNNELNQIIRSSREPNEFSDFTVPTSNSKVLTHHPFREMDHKFEFTRNEFKQWISQVLQNCTEEIKSLYEVEIHYLGTLPNVDVNNGATQVAVFIRKDSS